MKFEEKKIFWFPTHLIQRNRYTILMNIFLRRLRFRSFISMRTCYIYTVYLTGGLNFKYSNLLNSKKRKKKNWDREKPSSFMSSLYAERAHQSAYFQDIFLLWKGHALHNSKAIGRIIVMLIIWWHSTEYRSRFKHDFQVCVLCWYSRKYNTWTFGLFFPILAKIDVVFYFLPKIFRFIHNDLHDLFFVMKKKEQTQIVSA